MQKQLLTIFLAFFLSLNTFAAEIIAPESIPSNANWSFSAILDSSDSFDYTEIMLDDKKIAAVYSNGQVLKDPINGNFILNAFVFDEQPASSAGMIAHISYAGLPAGTYELRTVTFQSGNIKFESENVFVNSFTPIGQESQSTLEEKFGQIEADREKVLAHLNSIEEEINELEAQISLKDEPINSLKSQLESLNNSLNEMKNSFSDLETGLAGNSESIEKKTGELFQKLSLVEEKVFPKQTGGKLPLVGGLAGFAKNSGTFMQKNWLGIFLLLIAGTITFVKFSKNRLPSKKAGLYEEFEPEEKSLSDTDKLLNSAKDEEEEEKFQGKWASK